MADRRMGRLFMKYAAAALTGCVFVSASQLSVVPVQAENTLNGKFQAQTETQTQGADPAILANPAEESKDAAENTAAAGRDIISGISLADGSMSSEITVSGRPSLEELQEFFPQVQVTLTDGTERQLRVTWRPTEEYDSSSLYWLAFYPVLPEGFAFAQGQTEAVLPYVGVTFNTPGNTLTAGAELSGETLEASPAPYNTNEWQTYTFLRTQLQLNNAQACGIMANIFAESRFQTNVEGDPDPVTGALTSYGICQWHAGRKDALIRFCQENGYDYTTLQGQLQYLKEEADGTKDYIPEHFPLTMARIRAVPDTAEGAWQAGYLWCRNFERPAALEATSNSRGNLARDSFFENYAGTTVFNDVWDGSQYYYGPVYWAVGLNVTVGIGNGLFGTSDADICTRAQIVTFLYNAWKATGGQELSDEEATSIVSPKFTDVAPGQYYYKAVAWALRQGVTSGISNHEFGPDAPCTRAQAMTFLYNAMGKPPVDMSNGTTFTDVPAEQYYTVPVRWGVDQHITSGVGGGLFGVDLSCTRAQIVTFIYHAYDLS